TLAGVLILVPRFRRWGAWLAGALLVVFVVYFGIHYTALSGQECSCFPWVKRVVGPGFFIGDGIMLALAVVAGVWARPPAGVRSAALILAAVAVFAVVSYGVEVTRQTGVEAPATITVDGKPFSTHEGKVFIYFLDPECMHCFDAAKKMAKLNWGDTKVIAVAVEQPQFTAGFLQNTGLQAGISPDLQVLKKTFPFVNAPAGVALANGRAKATVTQFDGAEPDATLKKLGFVY
ncbi:MAG TPA: MauE/DoxX family redox-associated membrane protein, partial [Terriglobales bacterium]|nr:MauE/DoxX family redox-associated membrane protein [Terriglobales bacterium]